MHQTSKGAGSGARALWVLLAHTLVAPFLAALMVLLLVGLAHATGRLPAHLLARLPDLPADTMLVSSRIALAGYVWSAIPAAVTGLGLAGVAFAQGRYSWLVAVVVAAVVATSCAVITGGILLAHVTEIALIAAVSALGVRHVLQAAGLLGG